MKICALCNLEKDLDMFPVNYQKSGKKYIRNQCKSCFYAKVYNRMKSTPIGRAKLKRDLKYKKSKTRIPGDPKNLLHDCKSSDKKKGLTCDLDLEFIVELISKGCSYCQEKEILMSLDRIDNSVGHIKSNVISCCVRCNYLRGNMPYDAWLVVVKGVKEARELGLFGNWIGGIFSNVNS